MPIVMVGLECIIIGLNEVRHISTSGRRPMYNAPATHSACKDQSEVLF